MFFHVIIVFLYFMNIEKLLRKVFNFALSLRATPHSHTEALCHRQGATPLTVRGSAKTHLFGAVPGFLTSRQSG